MRAFADAGGSILFHSTEIPELVHLCDRVLVLYDGRVADRARRRCDSTEQAIMRAALGEAHAAGRGGMTASPSAATAQPRRGLAGSRLGRAPRAC